MFHRCKTREECSRLYQRISERFAEEKDLLILLSELYEREAKDRMTHFLDDSKGKFRKTKQSLRDDDWRVIELFDEMLYYKKENPEWNGIDFLNSVMRFCAANEFVSEKQYNKLVEIYYLNNMQNMEAFS